MTTGGVQVPDPSQPPHPCSQATADLLSVSVEQMGSFWSLAELGRCLAALTQRAASGRLHDVVCVSPSSLPPPQWHSLCGYNLLPVCLFVDISTVSSFMPL